MPDEPLALPTIPPTAEGDYDAICATLQQTERGRWFLAEHARHHRNAGAIEPVTAAIPTGHAQPPQSDLVAAVERLQDLAWTMREHGLDMATCEHIEILASTMLSAPWLRNPSDRRALKLEEALGHLERRIDSMIAAGKERTKEHAKAPLGEVPVPLGEAPDTSHTDGNSERSTDSVSVAAPPELSASGQTEPASTSDSTDADTFPVEPAADSDLREVATEPTIVRVPTMWDPASETSEPASPEPIGGASTPQTHPVDWTAEIDNELFAAPAPVMPRSTAAAPQSGAAGSAPIASTRSDPLAALNAMTDEEKLALFT